MNEQNGRTTALEAAATTIPDALEAALMQGDVAKLSPEHRTAYYRAICESVGLNWLTRPLDLMKGQDGKHQFYFRKEATDQLARAHGISFKTLSRERLDDLYIVEMQGTMPDGRSLDDQGIVAIGHEKGQAVANAMMKATTKARRRVTLGLVGLGWQTLDEESSGAMVTFSPESGQLLEHEAQPVNNTPLLFGDQEAADAARYRMTQTQRTLADQVVADERSVADTPLVGDTPPAAEKQWTERWLRDVANDDVSKAADACGAMRAALWTEIKILAPDGFKLRVTADLDIIRKLIPQAVAQWEAKQPVDDAEDWEPEAEIFAWVDGWAKEHHIEAAALKAALTVALPGWEFELADLKVDQILAWKQWAEKVWMQEPVQVGK